MWKRKRGKTGEIKLKRGEKRRQRKQKTTKQNRRKKNRKQNKNKTQKEKMRIWQRVDEKIYVAE